MVCPLRPTLCMVYSAQADKSQIDSLRASMQLAAVDGMGQVELPNTGAARHKVQPPGSDACYPPNTPMAAARGMSQGTERLPSLMLACFPLAESQDHSLIEYLASPRLALTE